MKKQVDCILLIKFEIVLFNSTILSEWATAENKDIQVLISTNPV